MYEITIVTDEAVTVTKQPHPPYFKQLQEAVGGWLEPVPHFLTYGGKHCRAFVNEEGTLRNLPINLDATALWWMNSDKLTEFLRGPLVIITADTEKELGKI